MAGASFPSDHKSDPYSRGATDLPPGEAPSTAMPTDAPDDQPNEEREAEVEKQLFSDEWLVQKSFEIYRDSTDYLDANITNFWERNLAHFNNEHPPGSRYRRKDWRRSRTFRPKTRANVKQQESALANAMFSTLSLVDVAPVNPKDPSQQIAAAVHKALLEYRLGNRMPWFLTVQGAYQNTKVYGLCISKQYWSYREDTNVIPALADDGTPIKDDDGNLMGYEEPVVREDKLCCDLVEPENFRFDAMCDWRNPAGTSPYLIHIVPMYAGEALEMMQNDNPKTGTPAWRQYNLAEILASRRQDFDRTRQAREGRQRIDPAEEQKGNEFTTVWAHCNIVRINGTDWQYWTMGTDLVLSDPVELVKEYPWLEEGERPFVVGYSTIESFRNFPAGDVEQSSPLQTEINEVANQRLDNVKLVLNKRYFVRRGSQVDLDALIRNTPGGGVMMNDPEKDVEIVNTPDVTSSSYQEQGVLGNEFDELVGGFNPASQSGNSVAGQQMGAATAGSVQDYGIKIFIETWMEPVLRQLQRLIAMYETDETIIQLAGEQANAFERMGESKIPDSIFLQNLYVRVDVGMGNTDPMRKVERLVFGVTQIAGLPGAAPRLKVGPIADAVFGALGYRDSSSFMMSEEEWQKHMEENPPGPTEVDVKMRELDIRDETEASRDERERYKIDKQLELEHERILAQQDMQLDNLIAQGNTAKMSDRTKRETEALKLVQQRASEERAAVNSPSPKEGTSK